MLRDVVCRWVVAAALILDLTAAPMGLDAQDPRQEMPPITIRATTRLVVVDVVVTDQKGQLVTRLKAEDFTLEEHGKTQKIAVFVPPGAINRVGATSPPAGVLSNRPENISPAGAPTLLLLDAANSPGKDQAYARLQMLKYAVEQAQTGSPIAVATLTDRLRLVQHFTSDPHVLATAISQLKPEEPVLRPGAPRPEPHFGVSASGPGGAAFASALVALQEFVTVQVGYDQERRTLITIDALKALSRILGGLSGRKNVVWLTAEFPFDLIPENRTMSETELIADLPDVRQKSLGTIASGALSSRQRELHGQAIRDAEAELASASVAIYPVDIRGLISGMEGSASRGASVYSASAHSDRALAAVANAETTQGTMEEVAAETGGKAYFNQNEIKNGIALAAADGKATYTLGYYPENKKWDGKFRSLKIKVAKSDVQLRYRKGYFAIEPGPSKDHNLEQDVAAALQINAPSTQISFVAQAKTNDPGRVKVLFLVDAHTLSAEDSGDGKKMNVSFYACIYDSNGNSLATQSVKVDRAFDTRTYQQIVGHGMMVPMELEIPAGGYELRLAVLDNKTGLIGTVSGPIGQ